MFIVTPMRKRRIRNATKVLSCKLNKQHNINPYFIVVFARKKINKGNNKNRQ